MRSGSSGAMGTDGVSLEKIMQRIEMVRLENLPAFLDWLVQGLSLSNDQGLEEA